MPCYHIVVKILPEEGYNNRNNTSSATAEVAIQIIETPKNLFKFFGFMHDSNKMVSTTYISYR